MSLASLAHLLARCARAFISLFSLDDLWNRVFTITTNSIAIAADDATNTVPPAT